MRHFVAESLYSTRFHQGAICREFCVSTRPGCQTASSSPCAVPAAVVCAQLPSALPTRPAAAAARRFEQKEPSPGVELACIHHHVAVDRCSGAGNVQARVPTHRGKPRRLALPGKRLKAGRAYYYSTAGLADPRPQSCAAGAVVLVVARRALAWAPRMPESE